MGLYSIVFSCILIVWLPFYANIYHTCICTGNVQLIHEMYISYMICAAWLYINEIFFRCLGTARIHLSGWRCNRNTRRAKVTIRFLDVFRLLCLVLCQESTPHTIAIAIYKWFGIMLFRTDQMMKQMNDPANKEHQGSTGGPSSFQSVSNQ